MTLARLRVPSWFWLDVAIPLLVTRVALTAIGLAALAIFSLEPSRVGWPSSGVPVLDIWSRWDSDWYMSIVEHGYFFSEGTFSSIAFAPAYPAMVRAVATLTSPDTAGRVLAGLIVSNSSLVAALVYLRLLVSEDLGTIAAGRAVRYLLVFPLSFFLSAVYAESAYLAFALASLYHARHGGWTSAGIFGAATALSRPFGVLIAIALVAEVLSRRAGWRGAPAAALPVAAFGAWMAVLWAWTGRITAYTEAQGVWGREFLPPWRAAEGLINAPYGVIGTSYSLVDLLLSAFFLLLVIRSWRLVRASAALWSSATLVFLLSESPLSSMPRFCLGLYPAYAVLGDLGRSRSLGWAYVVLAMLASTVFMARFALWYWVG